MKLDKKTQARKRGDDRAAQILDIADAQLNQHGAGAVSMRSVGDALGTSRALAYAYFDDQFRLIENVLARHVEALRKANIVDAVSKGSLIERSQCCGLIYARHVAELGSAIDIVLRDEAIARQVRGAASSLRSQIFRRLAKLAVSELGMDIHEAVTLIQLLAVIPNDAGRLAFTGAVTRAEALDLTKRLIAVSIDSLRPNR